MKKKLFSPKFPFLTGTAFLLAVYCLGITGFICAECV